jgi:hypothetical protein
MLWLIKNGVSEDAAFAMPNRMRKAACIVFGQFEGNEWEWARMRWKETT